MTIIHTYKNDLDLYNRGNKEKIIIINLNSINKIKILRNLHDVGVAFGWWNRLGVTGDYIGLKIPSYILWVVAGIVIIGHVNFGHGDYEILQWFVSLGNKKGKLAGKKGDDNCQWTFPFVVTITTFTLVLLEKLFPFFSTCVHFSPLLYSITE